jgi:hypothetical protein
MKLLLHNPDNGITGNFMPHLWMFLPQARTPPPHEVILLEQAWTDSYDSAATLRAMSNRKPKRDSSHHPRFLHEMARFGGSGSASGL